MNISPDSFAKLLSSNQLERVGWGGTRRCCFKIGDSGLCVKFYKPKSLYDAEKVKPSIRRDIDRRRLDPRRNSSCQEVAILERYRRILPKSVSAHFPPVCERVYHPDYGWGILETYYTNPDGTAIIPYEFEIARQTPENREIIYAQAAELLAALIKASAPFYEPGNFHTLINADGTIETKIVDFEPMSKAFLPLEIFWPWFRRRKLARKSARYLTHIRSHYGVEGKQLHQILAEDAFGVKFKTFNRVSAGNSSFNYHAILDDGRAFFVKLAPQDSVERTLARHGALASPIVPKVAFGGATGRVRGATGRGSGWTICALDWVAAGESVAPQNLTKAEVKAIYEGYLQLSADFEKIPRETLIRPDDIKEVESASGLRARPIHGDFHYKNFFLKDGCLSACFDFEFMRLGLPTEDLLRIFVHALERTRFWRFRRISDIIGNFAEMVRVSSFEKRAWLAAIDHYESHKKRRRAAKSRSKVACWWENWLRAPLYRRLRNIVEMAG